MSRGRIFQDDVIFFLCDVQERFRTTIYQFPEVLNSANRMLQCAQILEIPTFGTEHCPKVFGSTCSELEFSEDTTILKKRKFSMLAEEDFGICVSDMTKFDSAVKQTPRRTAVLFGVETHVCVQQTAFDLLERGFQVHILMDGTSSNTNWERKAAFERMKQSGVYLTTCEAVIYEILRTCEHPCFKAILKVVKTKNLIEKWELFEDN